MIDKYKLLLPRVLLILLSFSSMSPLHGTTISYISPDHGPAGTEVRLVGAIDAPGGA